MKERIITPLAESYKRSSTKMLRKISGQESVLHRPRGPIPRSGYDV